MPTDLNLAHGTVTDGGGTRADGSPLTWATPENANDGNGSSNAVSGAFVATTGTWTRRLKSDLGAAYSVDEMVITGSFNNGDPAWQVWWSDDGTAWTLVTETYHVYSPSPIFSTTIRFDAITHRYWRVGWTRIVSGFQYIPAVYTNWYIYEGSDVIADFSGTPRTVEVGEEVDFTDASTGGTINGWDWDFGDGEGSTLQNPSHSWDTPGFYDITLTASNTDPDDDTEVKTSYIHVLGPGLTEEVYEFVPPGDTLLFRGNLTDAYDRVIRPVRNEPGTGQFTINRNSPNATDLIVKPGNLVRVTIPDIDHDSLFAWLMETGDFTLVSSDEEGGETITIGGRGALAYWDRAVWLADKFTIPWWDAAWGDPPAGARGHVHFAAGTYRRYTVTDPDDGPITGYTNFTTAGFEAYFDRRRTYQWPSENNKRFLVRIMAGETHAGWYVHPHQDGVTETLPSQATGTTNSVLLSDISPDTPGVILHYMYLEGQSEDRPSNPIPLMTIDFDDTVDSNGDPWATTDALAGVTAELGETYLETIMKLVATGVIDVEMGPDLDMHAYNAQGRDLTGDFGAGVVRFEKGVNIASELKREREDNPVATFAQVVGTDNVTATAELPDAASRVTREISVQADSADTSTLEAVGLAELNVRLVASDAIAFEVAVGEDEDEGLYLPGREGTENGKYWLGDDVTLHTGTGDQDFDEVTEKVFAVTITEDEAANLVVLPEVGSQIGEAERRLFDLRRKIERASEASSADADPSPDTETAHPDLAVHDALGLATDTEVAAAASAQTTPVSARFTFDSTTTDADPGAGNLRLSNASQYLAVTARVDLTDSDGADVTALLDVIAANPTGYMRLQKRDDPTKWLVATVSASASPSGYRNITIANIAKSANSPFTNGDKILMSFVGSGGGSALTVEEEDGSPSDTADTLVFPAGSVTFDGATAHIRDVPQAFIGAKATNTAATSIANNTDVAMPFATEEFDTDGFHDTVTNNTRMTIPAGLGGKYLVIGQFTPGAAITATNIHARIRKNGTTDNGFSRGGNNTSQSHGHNVSTVLDLVPGDYVELVVVQNKGSAQTLEGTAGYNWLSIVKLDSGKVGVGIGAYAKRSTDQTAVATVTDTVVVFNGTEVFDTDGFHSTSVNPGRMTIPAGLGGKYIVTASVMWDSSTTGRRQIWFRQSVGSGGVNGFTRQLAVNLLTQSSSAILDLVAGEYVEVIVNHDAGSDRTLSGATVPLTFSIARLDSGTSAYSGAAWSSGTAFPSGPTTGQRFTRTDLGMDFYYDGTRWLCTCEHSLEFLGQVLLWPVNANTSVYSVLPRSRTGATSIRITGTRWSGYLNGTNTGAAYWNLTSPTGATANTSALAGGGTAFTLSSTTEATVDLAIAQGWIQCDATKTGSPGTLHPMFSILYRFIGT